MAMKFGFGLTLGLSGVGLAPPAAPVITAPVSTGNASILLVGIATTVSGTCEAGCSVNVYWNAVLLGAAVVVGTSWTYSWTPTSPQEGAFNLTAIATRTLGGQVSSASSAQTPLVLADAKIRFAANNSSSYTQSAGSLNTLVNLASGTSWSTKTGTPGWTANDASSGKSAFTFNGSSAIDGSEAAVITALGTTDRPFACFAVPRFTSVDANGVIFSSGLSSHATDGTQAHFAQSNSSTGRYYFYRQGASAAKTWLTTDQVISGRHVIEWRSTDGLTVFFRINGGAEANAVNTTLTVGAPDTLSIGSWKTSTRTLLLTGSLHEFLWVSAHKSSTIMTEIRNRLTAEWV